MKPRILGTLAIAAFAVSCLLGNDQSLAQNAYFTNADANDVSVIDTRTKTVIAMVPVGNHPWGVAVSPDGSKVYITNRDDATVSVINTRTNKVIGTIPAGSQPYGVAISPDGSRLYVANDVYPAGVISRVFGNGSRRAREPRRSFC